MSGTNQTTGTVVVTGDVTMDWNLARTENAAAIGPLPNRARACWQRGGAALLAEIISGVADDFARSGLGRFEVRQTSAPCDGVCPVDARFAHSYVMWDQYDAVGPCGGERLSRIWRVREFLGSDPAAPPEAGADACWQRVADDSADAQIVVLDDAGLGFRDRADLWPSAITSADRNPWVLLKVFHPLAQGALWEQLIRRHADRLIVIVNISDLRLGGAALGRSLSWERTATDLIRELVCSPTVNGLSAAAHVAVVMPTSGALLVSRAQKPGGAPSRLLFFDPFGVEWMWAKDRPGRMMGYSACVTACLTRELMASPTSPDIGKGVRAGLAATRRLHEVGYGVRGASPTELRLAFPVHVVVESKGDTSPEFAEVEVPHSCLHDGDTAAPAGDRRHHWTILESRHPEQLNELARRTVFDGPEVALPGVPIGRFGQLITVDRREIESLLAVRAVMKEYLKSDSKAPLSIAVFGPPGSGKSFAVEQVAESLLSSNESVLKFNLTQMGGEKELIGAFHQVRDKSLSGQSPLVFWDEFDTGVEGRPHTWLARFLAPMQDGAFQEGQITHPIGRAIFVFAGGISASMEQFDKGREDAAFKDAKGPDFVSRLKGYINVMGPNRQGTPGEDPYYVIRRAIILRSLLQRREMRLFNPPSGKGKLSIDASVLRAMLHVPCYRHGVRSMESIIAMSSLTGRTRFDRSCLPPESQAELHVDGKEFRKLLQQFEVEGELLEKLARAAHEVYCEGKKRDGWTYGPVRDNAKKIHSLLKDYAELEETYKDANRTTVRNIPRKLAAAGYAMTPATGAEPPVTFSVEDIEPMAEVEHELWMADRAEAGFRLGEPMPSDPKRNPYMVTWKDVSEDIKVIDRDLVKGIPAILARAGFGVVRVG